MEEAVEAVLLHGGGTLVAADARRRPEPDDRPHAALDELRPGEVLRFDRVVVTPGGKGLNVARAARALGTPALLVALRAGPHRPRGGGADRRGGDRAARRAVRRRAALDDDRAGARRAHDGAQRAGAGGRRAALGGLRARGARAAAPRTACSSARAVVPPGAPADAYGRLARSRARRAARAWSTPAGATLLRALAAAPDLVTPNLAEAEGALGLGAAAASRWRAAQDARPRRAGGGRGAAAPGRAGGGRDRRRGGRRGGVRRERASGSPAPRVAEVRNPIGAGDVFLAALARRVGARRERWPRRRARGRRGRGERRAPDGGGARPGAGAGCWRRCWRAARRTWRGRRRVRASAARPAAPPYRR